MTRRAPLLIACTAGATFALGTGGLATASDGVPSGQRIHGQSVIEPVYDGDAAGVIGFIGTPANAPVRTSPRARAPLYLPVYPEGSTVGALICPHVPVDTCPDHGPGIAALAEGAVSDVYGAGVLGHDHLTAFRGGDDFAVALEPVVVLFTSTRAANEHLLTADAIDAAIGRGDAIAIPLAGAALHGEQVSATVWDLATPIR